MNRQRLPAGRPRDAGAALFELVLAIGLTALAAGSIMGLVVSSGRIAERVGDDDLRAGVAVDWLTEDIQRSSAVRVDAVDGDGVVTAITLAIVDGAVTWEAAGGEVRRSGPETTDMVVVATPAALGVTFEILGADGVALDPGDSAAITACAHLVRFELADTDTTARSRTVGLRRLDGGSASC